MQRASREATSNGQGIKQIDSVVTVHSSSSSSRTSAVQGFFENSGNDFQTFSRGTTASIKTGKGRVTLMDTKSQSVQWKVLNLCPSNINNKF